MRLFKIIFSFLISLPIASVAYAAIDSNAIPSRMTETTWQEVYDKLVNNRMPPEYYIYLQAEGISSLDEIAFVNDEIKSELVKKYEQDKIIMAGSNKTMSIK
jgi:hypothetical protein